MDFKEAKRYILSRLEKELNPSLHYHGIHHTIDVYEATIKLGELEKLSEEEIIIVKTAALYHDAGFMYRYEKNEPYAAQLVQDILPSFNYSQKAIKIISNIILTTQLTSRPQTLLEKIMSDADYDYLGREDVKSIAATLYKELLENGASFSEAQWNRIQIKFLNKHEYYTASAISLRRENKWTYMRYLKNLEINS